MRKSIISIVVLSLVLISCRQDGDVQLSKEDVANIDLIQKNRTYRNSNSIKKDTISKIQTSSGLISDFDPNKPPKIE